MSSTLLLLLSVLALTASVKAAKEHDKHERHGKSEKRPSCQEFSQGVTFNDSQALGTWHLLHQIVPYQTQTENRDSKCIEFSLLSEQQSKNLSEVMNGKYGINLHWEKMTLKMQIPCVSNNPNRFYYLEKLGEDGYYRTLQIPHSTTGMVNIAALNRYPMRLKIIEGQYLGMMDCHENLVFLLGKKPLPAGETDPRLKKLIETYWPEED